MSYRTSRTSRRALMGAALAAPLIGRRSHAAVPVITDAVGRTIDLKRPAERIVLGFNYEEFTAVAGPDRLGPCRRVFQDAMGGLAPVDLARYLRPIPRLAGLPDVGNTDDNTFSLERLLSLRPDLVTHARMVIHRSAGSGPADRSSRHSGHGDRLQRGDPGAPRRQHGGPGHRHRATRNVPASLPSSTRTSSPTYAAVSATAPASRRSMSNSATAVPRRSATPTGRPCGAGCSTLPAPTISPPAAFRAPGGRSIPNSCSPPIPTRSSSPARRGSTGRTPC